MYFDYEVKTPDSKHGIMLHHLYPSDEKERYFHICNNERKQTSERENVEEKIDRMALLLCEHQGTKLNLGNEFCKYFDLIIYHEGQNDEKFMYGRERYILYTGQHRHLYYYYNPF